MNISKKFVLSSLIIAIVIIVFAVSYFLYTNGTFNISTSSENKPSNPSSLIKTPTVEKDPNLTKEIINITYEEAKKCALDFIEENTKNLSAFEYFDPSLFSISEPSSDAEVIEDKSKDIKFYGVFGRSKPIPPTNNTEIYYFAVGAQTCTIYVHEIGNITPCENMVDLSRAQNCCDNMEKRVDKLNCLEGVAVAHNDLETCDYLGVSSPDCYWKIGKLRNDINICKRINAAYQRNYCIREVNPENKTLEDCDLIEDTGLLLDCYTGMAGYTGDIALCDNMTDIVDDDFTYTTNYQDTCYDRVGIKLTNKELCKSEFCYWWVAIKSKNISTCQRIGTDKSVNSTYSRDQCILSVSIANNNPETCNRISDGIKSDLCAKQLLDVPFSLDKCEDYKMNGTYTWVCRILNDD